MKKLLKAIKDWCRVSEVRIWKEYRRWAGETRWVHDIQYKRFGQWHKWDSTAIDWNAEKLYNECINHFSSGHTVKNAFVFKSTKIGE